MCPRCLLLIKLSKQAREPMFPVRCVTLHTHKKKSHCTQNFIFCANKIIFLLLFFKLLLLLCSSSAKKSMIAFREFVFPDLFGF